MVSKFSSIFCSSRSDGNPTLYREIKQPEINYLQICTSQAFNNPFYTKASNIFAEVNNCGVFNIQSTPEKNMVVKLIEQIKASPTVTKIYGLLKDEEYFAFDKLNNRFQRVDVSPEKMALSYNGLQRNVEIHLFPESQFMSFNNGLFLENFIVFSDFTHNFSVYLFEQGRKKSTNIVGDDLVQFLIYHYQHKEPISLKEFFDIADNLVRTGYDFGYTYPDEADYNKYFRKFSAAKKEQAIQKIDPIIGKVDKFIDSLKNTKQDFVDFTFDENAFKIFTSKTIFNDFFAELKRRGYRWDKPINYEAIHYTYLKTTQAKNLEHLQQLQAYFLNGVRSQEMKLRIWFPKQIQIEEKQFQSFMMQLSAITPRLDGLFPDDLYKFLFENNISANNVGDFNKLVQQIILFGYSFLIKPDYESCLIYLSKSRPVQTEISELQIDALCDRFKDYLKYKDPDGEEDTSIYDYIDFVKSLKKTELSSYNTSTILFMKLIDEDVYAEETEHPSEEFFANLGVFFKK